LQISFQEFKNKLLEAGIVDRIEVTNKSLAKVYVNAGSGQVSHGNGGEGNLHELQTDTRPPGGQSGSQYKYYFNIGSIESFERKLEDAQDMLGVNPHDYVPVTYVSEMSWQQELLRLAPTILLIAGYIYFSRRMQGGGFGIGGGSGSAGGRGIFNVGKAQVTKLSKKAKDKVCHFVTPVVLAWLLLLRIFLHKYCQYIRAFCLHKSFFGCLFNGR
jgi:AFG3 family protein